MVAAQSGSTSNEAALADAVEELQTAADKLTGRRSERRPHPGAEQPGRRGAGPQPLPARGGYRDAQPGHLGGPAAPAPVRHDAARRHHRQRPDRPRAPPGAARPDPGWSLLPGHAAGAGRHRPLRRHRLPGALLRARRRGRCHRPSGRRPRLVGAGRRGPAHRERPALPRDPHRRHRPRWPRRLHAVRQPRHDADGRHRPAAVDVRHRREDPRPRQRRHHARRPAGRAAPGLRRLPPPAHPDPQGARGRAGRGPRGAPRGGRPDPCRRGARARSSRSTSPPRRRWASWPGPSTTCTSRRCCWRRARPACVPRSARCS